MRYLLIGLLVGWLTILASCAYYSQVERQEAGVFESRTLYIGVPDFQHSAVSGDSLTSETLFQQTTGEEPSKTSNVILKGLTAIISVIFAIL